LPLPVRKFSDRQDRIRLIVCPTNDTKTALKGGFCATIRNLGKEPKMIKRIFHSKTKNFTSAAFLIAVSTILSGLLGLLRDRFLAGTFGAGETLDIYFAAFRIPDLVQGIFIAGGIGVAFLPLFSEEIKKGKDKAFLFANNLLNTSLVFLLLVCFLLFLLVPKLLVFIAPGFSPEQRIQTVSLTRLMLLSPILFGLSSVFSGILQFFNRFFVYSLAPILYNLGIIFGILFFVPLFGISGLAIGVILGALIHFLIQVPSALRLGYDYKRIFDLKNYRLKKVSRLMIPSSLGAGFIQLNLVAMTAISSTLSSGSIAIFNLVKNLQSLPIGIVGVPFAIAAFPALAKSWTEKNKEKFSIQFSLALRQILFLIIPLSLLFFLLRGQIVRIVLSTGLWGWQETRLAAACLGIFSFSIFGLALTAFFRKGFYSIQETRIPMTTEGINLFLNVSLSLFFLFLLESSASFKQIISQLFYLEGVEDIRIIALPLALSFSSVFQTFLLLGSLVKKAKIGELKKIFSSLKKIIFLTILMGFGIWLGLKLLAVFFSFQTFWPILFETIFSCLVGGFIYLVGALVLNLPELKNLKDSIF